jgi:hypothetical protein
MQKLNSSLSTNRPRFPRINSFFDAAELIVERLGKLLTKCEPTTLRLFLLAHLVFDLVFVGWCIVTKL